MQQMGTRLFSESEKDLDVEGRGDWHHPSHAVPLDRCEASTFNAPTADRLRRLPLVYLSLVS